MCRLARGIYLFERHLVVSRTAERVARVERAARRSVTPGSRARTALVGEAPLVGVVGEARGLRVERPRGVRYGGWHTEETETQK